MRGPAAIVTIKPPVGALRHALVAGFEALAAADVQLLSGYHVE